jgi:2-polyprenyl-3-methyl-5-hydroxy-6-metoxy-1,4-benzoquinol methylase
MNVHAEEIARGERFEFGKNWSRFLALIDDKRIDRAKKSLTSMLELEDLHDKAFLDIGCGSGLFSLAARALGARVHSFDFDPQSVACTLELKRRYFPKDELWIIEEASVLDASYMNALGKFQIVYSWGVLHHTGALWQALEHANRPVAPGGKLFIALYNDAGSKSARWKWIKKTYNNLPSAFRTPFAILAMAPQNMKDAMRAVLKLELGSFISSWTQPTCGRGMSRWRDLIDWVGGYPYEVSTPDEIFDFFRARGFVLTKLRCGRVGLGCNEFVFEKDHTTSVQ